MSEAFAGIVNSDVSDAEWEESCFRCENVSICKADEGSGTAAAHRTALFIAITSLLEINATDINVNPMRIMGIAASASINRLLGKCMVLRAVDRLTR